MIKKAYATLFITLLCFAGISVGVQMTPAPEMFLNWIQQNGTWGFLAFAAAYIISCIGAQYIAETSRSKPVQLVSLGVYTLAEVAIFMPLFFYAKSVPDLIPIAAGVSVVVCSGLMGYVLQTGKDFTFLGGMLTVGLLGALAALMAGIIFSFNIMLFIGPFLILLAAGVVLYETSNLEERYGDNYIAAGLGLFAAVGMFFYYVLSWGLRIMGSSD